MDQNVFASMNEVSEADRVTFESNTEKTTSKNSLREKTEDLQSNIEPRNELKESANIPIHVIQSIVAHHLPEVLTDCSYQIISDFCSDKLTKVLKSAIDTMKFSGRSKFTIADFNQGLYINDEELLIESRLPLNNRRNKRKRDSIDISSYINGTVKSNFQHFNVHIYSKWLNGNPFSKDVANLPSELQKYFNVVTKVLLGKNEKMCFKIIQDFKTNDSILHLTSYFVNFFSCNLNRLGHDFSRISVFLKALDSLLSNSYLYLGQSPFSNELAYTILKFLVSDRPNSNHVSDWWLLKDTAAYVLVKVLKRNKSKELFLEIVQNLESVFSDFKQSLISHYGAVVVSNSIGVPAIMLAISPHFNEYCKHINMCASDFQKRHDVSMVQGRLIHSYYQLIHHYFKYEFYDTSPLNIQHYRHLPVYYIEFLKNYKVFPFLSHSSFVDSYGDTLVQCFPLSNFVSYDFNYRAYNVHNEHFLNRLSPQSKATFYAMEPPSASFASDEKDVTKKDKMGVRYTNGSRKKSSLKAGLTHKQNSIISRVLDEEKLHSKNPLKETREKIFDIIPLKKCAVKFGDIQGLLIR